TLGDLLAYLRAPGLLEQPALADRLELDARRRGAFDAPRARAIWEQRHWRLEAAARIVAARERGPRDLLDRAARDLERLFAAARRRQAHVLAGEELAEADAFSVVCGALTALRG